MRNMIIALTALAGIACGGPVSDAESMADAYCECEDKECIEKVEEDYKDKSKEIEEALKEASDDDKKAIEDAAAKAAKCILDKM